MAERELYKGMSYYLPEINPSEIFVITRGDENSFRGNFKNGIREGKPLPEMIEIAPAKPSGNHIQFNQWEPANEQRHTISRNRLSAEYANYPTILPRTCSEGKIAKTPHNHEYCLIRQSQ